MTYGPVGPYRCRAVSGEALDYLADALAEHADADGQVRVTDVRRLVERLRRDDSAVQGLYTRVFDTCHALMEERRHAQRRRDAFSRAIIARFDHLFSRDQTETERLPRHVIPGMIAVLHHLLGEATVESHQEECQAILTELRERDGADFTWARYFADARVQRLVLHTVVTLAIAFRDFDRRRRWFINLIDQYGFMRGVPHGEGLSDRQFLALAENLFAPAGLPETGAREEVGRFGMEALHEVRRNLQSLRRALDDTAA